MEPYELFERQLDLAIKRIKENGKQRGLSTIEVYYRVIRLINDLANDYAELSKKPLPFSSYKEKGGENYASKYTR